MANKKIKSESYGTQRQTWAGGAGAGSNFQHGKDLGTHTRGSLGTRGADSNWSRASQAVMPLDAFTHFLDEDEEFDEDYTVEDSKYDLQEVLRLNEGAITDLVFDLGGDIASAGLGAIPGFGSFITAAFAGWNIKQLDDDLKEAKVAVEAFKRNQNDEILEKMEEKFDDIGVNLVDLFQRIIELLPDLEAPAAELASVGTSVTSFFTKFPRLMRLKDPAKNAYKSILGMLRVVGLRSSSVSTATSTTEALRRATEARSLYSKAKTHGIVIPVMKFVIEAMDAGLAPEEVIRESGIVKGSANMMILLADLLEDYYIQKEAYLLSVGDMESPPPFVYQHRILGAGERIEDYSIESSSTDPLPAPSEYGEENIEYDEDDDLSEPVVVGGAAAGAASQNSTLGNEFLRKLFISKPGDEGLFRESLENKSLLYLIEEKDSELDEELEEDEINEFSGAGGGAIGTLPLGMSTKGPKGKTSATSGGAAFPYSKKSRTAFKKYAKKSFGGK